MLCQDCELIIVNCDLLEVDVVSVKVVFELVQIDLQNIQIIVFIGGQLGQILVCFGVYVSVGIYLILLVLLQYWVIVNFKEIQLVEVCVGQLVIFIVDVFNGEIFYGKVQSIFLVIGVEFSVIFLDNVIGNFVKIVQCILVCIMVNDG